MIVSIIIPANNEVAIIAALLGYLGLATAGAPALEIMVVDGGSTDATGLLARQARAAVLTSLRKGRTTQLNYDAQQVRGEVLYFLPADAYPLSGFWPTCGGPWGGATRRVAAGWPSTTRAGFCGSAPSVPGCL